MKSNQIKTGATPLESPPQTAFTLKISFKTSALKKSSHQKHGVHKNQHQKVDPLVLGLWHGGIQVTLSRKVHSYPVERPERVVMQCRATTE